MKSCDWERLVAAGLPAKDVQEAQHKYMVVSVRSSLDGELVQVLRRIRYQQERQDKELYETLPERKRSGSVSIGPMRMELLSFETAMNTVRREREKDAESGAMTFASAILSSLWDLVAAASVYTQSKYDEVCAFVWTFMQLPTKDQDDLELLFVKEDQLWATDCEIEQAKMHSRPKQKQIMTSWRTRRIT